MHIPPLLRLVPPLSPSGLTNPEEFSFTTEEETSEQTVRRHQQYVRDQKKLDTLKKKLHTDDECEYVFTWEVS